MMIPIKYGQQISEEVLKDYCENYLVSRFYKLLPLKEQNANWSSYLETLLVEMAGANELLLCNSSYIALLSKLEGLRFTDVHTEYRKIVFECITFSKKLPSKFSGDLNVIS